MVVQDCVFDAVTERPSCIQRGRVRSPHGEAVRSLLAVPCGLFWTMASPADLVPEKISVREE
jgi:hypothetical protein